MRYAPLMLIMIRCHGGAAMPKPAGLLDLERSGGFALLGKLISRLKKKKTNQRSLSREMYTWTRSQSRQPRPRNPGPISERPSPVL